MTGVNKDVLINFNGQFIPYLFLKILLYAAFFKLKKK